MTIKQTLTAKISELELKKASLINKSSFLNPGNDAFVYSTLGIQDTEGVGGVTPQGLRSVMGVIVEKINAYTNYLKKMPSKETLAVRNDRGVYKYVIVSKDSGIIPKVTWNRLADGVSFSSAQQYLPTSVYHGAKTEMRIECSPVLRKGGEAGVPANVEAVVLRINPRKGIYDTYSSGGGGLSVAFDEKHLYGDDVLIVGLKVDQLLVPGAVYYASLIFSIKSKNGTGEEKEDFYTINNIPVGNMILDVDTTVSGGILLWTAFTINDLEVRVRNSSTNRRALIPDGYYGTLDDGDVVTDIIVGNEYVNVEASKLSYRRGVFKGQVFFEDSYSLYDKRENGISRIVVKNIIPIDIVLSEAINAL